MAGVEIEVRLEQQQDYRFEASFAEGVPPLVCDEPPPLGGSAGPSPIELLAAAVGNCLCDSLLFALRKFRLPAEPLSCRVTAREGRNEQGRLRIVGMLAQLRLSVGGEGIEHLDRALAQFEAFCTVTQSVGAAIPVEVTVHDAAGVRLK
jgi:uncharacterized OsmC-like protein